MPLYKRLIEASVEKNNLLLITVKGFRMSFTIKKVASTDPNTCQLTIYNLSGDTRNKLNETGSILTVLAGYDKGEGAEIIFVGNVNLVSTSRDYPDTQTIIEARDGEEALTFTRDSISFKEGVSIKQILKSVIEKFKIGIKTNLDLLSFTDKHYNQGFCFTGQLRSLLDKLTKDAGLTWSIQNNELKLYGNTSTDQSVAVLLNSQTGLLGSPKRIKLQKGKKTQKVDIDGWKLKSLIQPKAEPGGIVVVSSEEIGSNKRFKIDSVEHNGDNWEGDFQTVMEVIEYE